MNEITATISTVAIVIEVAQPTHTQMVANEARPANLEAADTMLAFNSYGRVGAWDLGPNGTVQAQLKRVDNRFSGTVAARLNQAVGTTHEEFEVMPAHRAEDGDLISDLDISDLYVVAGSRREGDIMRIHMVSEGKTWEDRYTTNFQAGQFVQVARLKVTRRKA